MLERLCAGALVLLALVALATAQQCGTCVTNCDEDGDDICDRGWNRTCCGGERFQCNDNCVPPPNSTYPASYYANPLQQDTDIDCRGNVEVHTADGCLKVCDLCPDNPNPRPVNLDGDPWESVCDCDDHDATIPAENPCPLEPSQA